jgi:adenine C2-methylase RlmN of 23S rRNA A2503 and tRNA A37
MTLHGDVAATTRTDGVRFVFEVTNDGTAVEDIIFRDAGKAAVVVEPQQGDGPGRDGEDGN